MALIQNLNPSDATRSQIHEPVDATFRVFEGPDGSRYLQIDTVGSPMRQIPGKVSQSVQFGPAVIAQLRKILDEIT